MKAMMEVAFSWNEDGDLLMELPDMKLLLNRAQTADLAALLLEQANIEVEGKVQGQQKLLVSLSPKKRPPWHTQVKGGQS